MSQKQWKLTIICTGPLEEILSVSPAYCIYSRQTRNQFKGVQVHTLSGQ